MSAQRPVASRRDRPTPNVRCCVCLWRVASPRGQVGDTEGSRLQYVDALTEEGWHRTSTGRTPWDLRFERDTTARELQSARSGSA